MAQFYAEIQGNRGEATRMGSKESGIHGHIRGWDLGARVSLHYDKEKDTDILVVSITGGSNAGHSEIHLVTAYRTENGLRLELRQR